MGFYPAIITMSSIDYYESKVAFGHRLHKDFDKTFYKCLDYVFVRKLRNELIENDST